MVAVVAVLAALLPAATGVGAAAAEAPAAWSIEQLMQNLRQVKSAKGKFVERKYMAMLNAPLDASGTLVYTAPGRLEKVTLLPKPETLVLDQNKLSIEYKDRNQRRTLVLPERRPLRLRIARRQIEVRGELRQCASLNLGQKLLAEATTHVGGLSRETDLRQSPISPPSRRSATGASGPCAEQVEEAALKSQPIASR